VIVATIEGAALVLVMFPRHAEALAMLAALPAGDMEVNTT
jgi:hypothetical protein